MSFSKKLQCGLCSTKVNIHDENFPEDLHDLLSKYANPRLYWICISCHKRYFNNDSGEMLSLKDEIDLLKVKVESLECNMVKLRRNILLKSSDADSDSESVANSFEHSCFEVSEPSISDSGYQDSRSEGYSSLILPHEKSPSPTSSRSRSCTPHSVCRNSHSDDEPKKKCALPIIDYILKTKIKIDPKESMKSSNIVTKFLEDITPAFKKDALFRYMYARDYKTGSSYNELRISSASEYDIEIVFKAPSKMKFEVEFFPETLTFAKLKWKQIGEISPSKMDVLAFFEKNSENGNLKSMKISAWFHGLIDTYLNSNPEIPGIKEMRNSQSGPARTIEIDTDEGYHLSIDLLPAFMFTYDSLVGTKIDAILKKYPVEKAKEFWFLVPKLCKGEVPILAGDVDFSWRVDFPEVEKKVLHNKLCAKNVVKLLKLLRDIENWNIASYHLKTLILWAIDENPNIEHWQGTHLFDRYLEALKSLQQYAENGELSYFMDHSYNLFHVFKQEECNVVSNRLKKIIKDIESDPKNLKLYYS